MASGQKTEQPTHQRLRKSREDGRFPVSREFVFSVQFFGFVCVLSGFSAAWFHGARELMTGFFQSAFRGPLTVETLVVVARRETLAPFGSFTLAAFGLFLLALGTQLATTGFGFAGKRLMPDFSRLSPANKLRELPKQNRRSFFEALILLPVFCTALWLVLSANAGTFLRLPYLPLRAALEAAGGVILDLLWKAVWLFLAWGTVDLFMQQRRWREELKMTKQEVKDELKQSDGNPEIKMRLRRLRRELLRRRMMAEVPTATAIIVNPTHFAVAIRYKVEAMAAPKVVAKGKNYLALRIREKALAHQVPVIENPPLAQALYKTVDVGQEIPPHLYRAVAEILAYLYRILNGRLPG